MKATTRPAVAILLLLIALTITTTAQQKRQTPAKPQPKPTPAPTFETLVPADSYIIYGEVRGVGQVIRSSALNDLLEPVLKLSGPPKEFRTVVKWLKAHAEEVMTSRLLLATWPNDAAKNLPQSIIAIEFASPEEAAKFSVGLNEFLPTVLPPTQSAPSDAAEKPKGPPAPNFHLKRFGSLIVVTPKPWTSKQLKPAGSKLLAEDTNFRAAHNRFNSEPVFVYVDTKVIRKEEEESRKRWEQERLEAQKRAEAEGETKKEEEPPEPELTGEEKAVLEAEEMARLQAAPQPSPVVIEGAATKDVAPEPLLIGLSQLAAPFFDTESEWPEGIALALSFEGESFDLRALLLNQPGEKADALPFLPMLITGPALVPEAANIFPTDSELLVTMSLDLPQIYATLSKPRPKSEFTLTGSKVVPVAEATVESPLAEFEKQLKLSIKDDLLPLLGSEVALRLPMNDMSIIGLAGIRASLPQVEVKEKQSNNGPALAIAVKDKEAVRALMPKIIENLGFKGAGSLAQTERREDTEIISFANAFSYAFVGNFLVLSGEPATIRHIVDSYLKHETLASDGHFRNSTRWQPKPQQGQIYLSPALMESYKVWAEQPGTRVSDETRAFLVRASSVAQPITYSLSNEGLGPLHEVHIPKNLVLMAVAGFAGEANPPTTIANERAAIGLMYNIAYAEHQYQQANRNGSYGTLEQLMEVEFVPKDMIERSGYKFEVTVSGDKFEVSAVPVEYGKSGHLSLFLDHTRILRGADRNGASATVSDPPIN
ncbi:MAG TPA: DUF3352 domain-containing protein [Pyrinomonadaceae bacterium]|nr:DUF3352 domain-containing protein [Pyrinomonadaceae bacterium]